MSDAKQQLTKDELRAARLRAMGLVETTSNERLENDNHQDHAMTPATEQDVNDKSCEYRFPFKRSLMVTEINSLIGVMYLGGGADYEDLQRWCDQGFELLPFGLKQGYGGPCGILAAVFAEIIKEVIFHSSVSNQDVGPPGTDCSLPNMSQSDLEASLVTALSRILARASNGASICFVECSTLSMLFRSSSSENVVVHELNSETEVRNLLHEKLNILTSSQGCIIFLLSLILTRGVDRIASDMDVKGNTLIGQFGHCTQELINLLLTGRATSNVIDGEISMPSEGSEGSSGAGFTAKESALTIRGISKKSSIGYLTHLEALRLCQVGDYYKVPEFPVWVIGSSSHFTILFALQREANSETESERLFSVVQRAFKSIDTDDCGFISCERLKEVLFNIQTYLSKESSICTDSDLARLRKRMEIDGGGIVLWSTFWEVVSQLLTGSTIDEVTDCSAAKLPFSNETNRRAFSSGTRPRSDSEVARDLQSQLDGNIGSSSDYNSSSHSTRQRSDSDVARELQAQWNAEVRDDINVAPASIITDAARDESSMANGNDVRAGIRRHDSVAEEGATSYIFYHFNGMTGNGRSAKLTRFKLTPRSAGNLIGQPVPMSASAMVASSVACPLEEVLRTRWPGCRVDWLEACLPSID